MRRLIVVRRWRPVVAVRRAHARGPVWQLLRPGRRAPTCSHTSWRGRLAGLDNSAAGQNAYVRAPHAVLLSQVFFVKHTIAFFFLYRFLAFFFFFSYEMEICILFLTPKKKHVFLPVRFLSRPSPPENNPGSGCWATSGLGYRAIIYIYIL